MAGKSFTAQLEAFEKLTVQNLKYVASESIQDVMEGMQTPARGISKGGTLQVGKIPVAESELINSLTSNGGAEGADSYTVAIAGYDLGDVMSFAYTAPHALVKEVGSATQQGWHFMGFNARKFPEHVAKHVKEVQR